MYYAQNLQTDERLSGHCNPYDALQEAEDAEWDDCDTMLGSWERGDDYVTLVFTTAEFPCTYYGDYECELTSNRPDSLCHFHAGDEE